MGTSSSYPGPPGPPPLLPPWAQDPLQVPLAPVVPVAPQSPPAPQPPDGQAGKPAFSPSAPPETGNASSTTGTPPPLSWRSPKRAVGEVARGGGAGSVSKAARAYVRASGGAHIAATTAQSGRRSTAAVGRFLTDVARGGIAAAAATLGIFNLVGRDAQSVLAALADALAPDGALREESISRLAVIETLDALFQRFDVEANGIDALNAMDAQAVAVAVELSITNYVNARFQEELISRVERGAMTEREANQCASQIREFIETNVRLDLKAVDVLAGGLDSPEGKRFVDAQYERAYRLLGGEK